MVLRLLFFLNKNVKNDFILLKSNGGIPIFQLIIFTLNMNYLAHAYLSFQQPEILVGNMISDHVKGKTQFGYPLAIQKGISLHRAIDHYTDTHAATQELKSFFRPQYRLYSGAFADIAYDHFLANDVKEFDSETVLKEFAASTYQILQMKYEVLPPPFQQMFPYMKEYDWLYNYRFTGGIERSFTGLVRRAAYLTESKIAFEIFNTHYNAMQACYAAFFPSLKKYAADHLSELLHS